MLTRSESNLNDRQHGTPCPLASWQAERNPRHDRALWHDPDRRMGALGCHVCPERALCGGLQMRAGFFDCLQFCCGKAETCDRVCRKHPDFADRVREVETFDLGTVPRAPVLAAPPLPRLIPVIYGRTARYTPAVCTEAALRLYQMFDRRTGKPRFTSHGALCKHFGIRPDTTILLTGVNRDPPLERWWELGEACRIPIIRAMRAIGISLVTTPNYSLFTDRPRWDDLHAIKRIAIVHEEFLREEIPAALHINGRTETDFERWTSYIAGRPEITHLAYEFTTGTRCAERRKQHLIWLDELAAAVGRPLHLVVRGGIAVFPVLTRIFAGVTVLDTSIYMKTMKRQRAYRNAKARLDWENAPTARNAPVDELFAENYRTVDGWLHDFSSPSADREVYSAR